MKFVQLLVLMSWTTTVVKRSQRRLATLGRTPLQFSR